MDNSVFNISITLITGYLFGIIQPAYFIGNLKGIDVKNEGSKNAGASNIVMLLGWKYGVLVFFIDLLKSLVPVLFFYYLSNNLFLSSIVGLGAMIGHIHPFYMNFNGGKGFSSYFGLIFGLDSELGTYLFLFSALLVMITNYVGLATILSVTIFVISLIYYQYFEASVLYIIAIASVIIIIKHLINLKKILKGEEKTFWSVILKNK